MTCLKHGSLFETQKVAAGDWSHPAISVGTARDPLLDAWPESSPVDVVDFAVTTGVHDEPTFDWWVLHILDKRNRIIAKDKKQVPRENPEVWV